MQQLRICGPKLWNIIDPAIIAGSQSWHTFKRQFKNSCWHIMLLIIIINISYNIFFSHGLVKSTNFHWHSGQAVIQVLDFLA